MAVISVLEDHSERESSQDTSPNIQIVRSFKVYAESGDDTETVRVAASVPKIGDAHPSNASAVCQRVRIRHPHQEDFWWVFHVTAEYATRVTSPPGTEDENNDPTERRPRVSWGEEVIIVPAEPLYDVNDRDADVVAAVNSAWEPYDPGPTKDETIRVLTFSRYETTFNPRSFDANYKNHVNNATFLGYQAEEALLTSVTAENEYINGVYYWVVTYVFKFKVGGWKWLPQDQGFYELDDNGNQVRMRDADDEYYVRPQLLNGDGRRLVVDPTSPQPAVYLVAYLYPRTSFNGLNITLPGG